MPNNSRMLTAATRLMDAPAKVASVRSVGIFLRQEQRIHFFNKLPKAAVPFQAVKPCFIYAAAAKRRLEEPVPHLKKSSFCSFCSVFPCAEAGQFSKSNMPDHSAMRVIWAANRRTILLAHARAGSLSCRTRPGAREHTPAQLPGRTLCSKALVRRELPGCPMRTDTQ